MNNNGKSVSAKVGTVLNRLGIWGILVLLFIVLSITTGDTFLTSTNLINLVRQICVTGVCAVGATVVICSGELDLSAGAMAALTGCFSCMLCVNYHVPTVLAVLISIALGIGAASISGLIITMLHVPAFICTLGMMYVLNGFTMLLTRGTPIRDLPSSYKYLGRGYVGPIPFIVIVLLVLVLVFAFIFKYFQFGRDVVTVGENPVSARLSGINVVGVKIAAFAIGGAMSSLAGIMLMARLGSGQPTAADDLGLTAMAAVFVGGTSAVNTNGAMLKTLAGALFIGMINNGLNLLEVNAYWQKVVLGLIIIFAIALDVFRTARASAVKR